MYIFFFFLIRMRSWLPLQNPFQLTGKNGFLKGFPQTAYSLYYEIKFKSSCFERHFSTFFKIFNFFLLFHIFCIFPFYFQGKIHFFLRVNARIRPFIYYIIRVFRASLFTPSKTFHFAFSYFSVSHPIFVCLF